MNLRTLACFVGVVVGAPAWAQPVTPLPLPDGKGGIGFDDLRYDTASHTLLIPAGRSGNVDLVDPATKAVTPIPGFSKIAKFDAGHGQSVTSVDVGEGYLFATDRTALELAVVDMKSHKIALEVPLASAPDYVRYVAPTREIWVTEPGKKRIEVFTLSTPDAPATTPREGDATGSRARCVHRCARWSRVTRRRRQARSRVHAQVEELDDGDRSEDATDRRDVVGRLRRSTRHLAR